MRLRISASLSCAVTIALLSASSLLAQPNPDKNAYFGETHVHTSWSLDAFAIGNTLTTPGDAYKYFKGEPIKHPLGYDVKIDTPLDLAGVTDHSEYAGVVQLANDPGSAGQQDPAGAAPDPEGQDEGGDGAGRAVRDQHARRRPARQGADVSRDRRRGLEAEHRARRPREPAGEVHGVLLLRVDLDAEQHEPPPQRLLQGLRARSPSTPFSALDSYHPVDLWNWMDGQRKAGNELLAISHNANLSDGRMYPDRCRHRGASDRRRLRRVAHAQRAADRDQAAQGHVGDAPVPLAQRRVRELRDHVGSARRSRRAAFRTSSAATRGRP